MLRSHNSALELQMSEVFEHPVSHSDSVTQKDEILHKTHTHAHTHSREKRNYLLFFLKSLIKDLIFVLMKTTISRMPT